MAVRRSASPARFPQFLTSPIIAAKSRIHQPLYVVALPQHIFCAAPGRLQGVRFAQRASTRPPPLQMSPGTVTLHSPAGPPTQPWPRMKR
ncbi:hypothetical protein BD626DRAFT_236852 [Schizophyllum amplum]|uniref:Uncharacterized protein n=1 Tax=Schizophyllum amplum TaxID=97359 RepID=A0A550CJC0_9AGAR|nr:hypothetical protein BD626DRAFT_236852 [Auriculariopsis ampla]